MKNLLLLLLAVWQLPLLAFAADDCIRVGMINYFEVKDDLTDFVLAQPEHKDLKVKFHAYQAQQKEQAAAFMKQAAQAHKTGKLTIPFGDRAVEQVQRYEVQREVGNLAEKEFRLMIEKLYGDKYQVVLDGSAYKKPVFASVAIADLTEQFKGHLLKVTESR